MKTNTAVGIFPCALDNRNLSKRFPPKVRNIEATNTCGLYNCLLRRTSVKLRHYRALKIRNPREGQRELPPPPPYKPGACASSFCGASSAPCCIPLSPLCRGSYIRALKGNLNVVLMEKLQSIVAVSIIIIFRGVVNNQPIHITSHSLSFSHCLSTTEKQGIIAFHHK